MLNFKLVNVNPKNRKTGDCSTRALANTLSITYEEALDLQCEVAKKTYYGLTNKEVMDGVLEKFGYVKMKQPRKYNGSKYEVRELDEILTKQQMEEGVLITIANHITCIKEGCIQDLWDCGRKSVGNYWVRM